MTGHRACARRLRAVSVAALCITMLSGMSTAAFAGTNAQPHSSAGAGMYSTYVETRSRYFSDDLRKPHPMLMEDLLSSLMEAIDRLSRYTIPESLPIVHRVPHEKIEELACGGEKCAALAAYRSGDGVVYIDEALEPETDVFARSVLLHELVHYVQDISDELVDAEPCRRWSRREQQAYAIQMRFLSLAESEAVVAAYIGSTGLACPSNVDEPLQLDEPQS